MLGDGLVRKCQFKVSADPLISSGDNDAEGGKAGHVLQPNLWAQNKGWPAPLERLFPFSSGKMGTLFGNTKRTDLGTEVISNAITRLNRESHTLT